MPSAVALEIQSFRLPQWISVHDSYEPPGMQPFRMNLGRGETEAIWLSIRLPADQLIMDDEDARAEARRQGILVTGTLGILLRAKQTALFSSIRKEMDALRAAGFHISKRVYNELLMRAGED